MDAVAPNRAGIYFIALEHLAVSTMSQHPYDDTRAIDYDGNFP
jgi:hypothetical protein